MCEGEREREREGEGYPNKTGHLGGLKYKTLWLAKCVV
jgi:hypothetical protein